MAPTDPRPRSPGPAPVVALGAVTALVAMVGLARLEPAPDAPSERAARVVDRGAPSAPSAAVDLNTASREELERLPRVGPALAGRIEAARPFESVEELERVPGIGPRTVARLRDLVTVTAPERGRRDVEP